VFAVVVTSIGQDARDPILGPHLSTRVGEDCQMAQAVAGERFPFHLDELQISLVFASGSMAFLPLSTYIGAQADVRGRDFAWLRRMMALGLACEALAFALMGPAPLLGQALVRSMETTSCMVHSQNVLGVANALTLIAAFPFIEGTCELTAKTSLTQAQRMAVAGTIYNAAFSGGCALGPLITGALADYLTFGDTLLCLSVVSVVGMVLVLVEGTTNHGAVGGFWSNTDVGLKEELWAELIPADERKRQSEWISSLSGSVGGAAFPVLLPPSEATAACPVNTAQADPSDGATYDFVSSWRGGGQVSPSAQRQAPSRWTVSLGDGGGGGVTGELSGMSSFRTGRSILASNRGPVGGLGQACVSIARASLSPGGGECGIIGSGGPPNFDSARWGHLRKQQHTLLQPLSPITSTQAKPPAVDELTGDAIDEDTHNNRGAVEASPALERDDSARSVVDTVDDDEVPKWHRLLLCVVGLVLLVGTGACFVDGASRAVTCGGYYRSSGELSCVQPGTVGLLIYDDMSHAQCLNASDTNGPTHRRRHQSQPQTSRWMAHSGSGLLYHPYRNAGGDFGCVVASRGLQHSGEVGASSCEISFPATVCLC
jgi:MFS family permease